jgi:hypothetical protein
VTRIHKQGGAELLLVFRLSSCYWKGFIHCQGFAQFKKFCSVLLLFSTLLLQPNA